MPSFLSKVFGRKKDEKDAHPYQSRPSDGSLLEGKFEVVSPTISPTIANFPEGAHGKGNGSHANGKSSGLNAYYSKDKDGAFGLFKARSRTLPADAPQKSSDLPLLSLNLPGPKEDSNSRALGVVFEADPDAHVLLSDTVIGERRLTPLETLVLVRACSQAITARGV